jgi:3-oxoacyl-[acyl-carrier protein] reductase
VLLENKTAIVYGAAGSIGSAVARAYAREGARVHLVGRTYARLQAIAEAIRAAGGAAETTQLDVLDKPAVQRHADSVADTSAASTSASTRRPTTTSKDRRCSTCPSINSCNR